VKLVFELIGISIAVIICVFAYHPGDTDTAGMIGYTLGYGLTFPVFWLAVEFMRRIWRVLRRYDTTALPPHAAGLTS
jgi:hypothetical protein